MRDGKVEAATGARRCGDGSLEVATEDRRCGDGRVEAVAGAWSCGDGRVEEATGDPTTRTAPAASGWRWQCLIGSDEP
jgi:hypothetical protein